MRPLSWHEAHLFDGLTPAAMGKRVALMPIGLDAIGIEMHHQLADFAAGMGGDRHGRKGVERQTHALLPSGGKDCEAARPDPCCRLGGGQAGRVSRLFQGGERRALRGLAAGAGCPMVEKGLGGAMTRQGIGGAARSGALVLASSGRARGQGAAAMAK